MDLKGLHETVAHAPLERIKEFANRCLEGAEAEVKSPPKPALVMARVRETVDGEVFNLGEVLVTSCEVFLDGESGWGMVMGDDPERALCAAVLDAANARGVPEEMEGELSLQLAFAREDRRARWAKVRPTRVEFEEMKG